MSQGEDFGWETKGPRAARPGPSATPRIPHPGSGGVYPHLTQASERGHCVPSLVRAPGIVPTAPVCDIPAVNLGLLPTCLAAAGLSPPADRIIDGRDPTPFLTGERGKPRHRCIFRENHGWLEGIRSGSRRCLQRTRHYAGPMPLNRKLGFLKNHRTVRERSARGACPSRARSVFVGDPTNAQHDPILSRRSFDPTPGPGPRIPV